MNPDMTKIIQELISLLEEQENIANLKKYNLALQNLQISPDMRKFFLNNNRKK